MIYRRGVRWRLLIAFFGISSFAALAAIAAVYSFLAIGSVVERITQERVPAALGALEISRQAERIVAAAPAMLAVTTSSQREEITSSINAEVERLNDLIDELKSKESDPDGLKAIELAAIRLGENLTALDIMVKDRLTAIQRKAAILDSLSFANLGVQRALAPGLRVMDAKYAQLRKLIRDPNVSAEERAAAIGELTGIILDALPLQKSQVAVSAINDTLVRAASAATRADLELMAFPVRKSLKALGRLIEDLKPQHQVYLRDRLEDFDKLTAGPDSIAEARGVELDLIADGENLIRENADLSLQLTDAVDQLLARAKDDIATGNLEAGAVQRVSTLIMIAVVVLSLISSTLIVWLYVGRNLIARLTALSDSMLAIAGGNLRADLPEGGNDEIGRMAEALIVFRDTAIEVEESNLREVDEARRRLTAAIEAISEGFSLYDAEDRLVLCNSTYLAMLYPGIEDIVTPGTQFETIIRHAAEIGLIADAIDRIDDWIVERMGRHRNPSGQHIQRRGDGRWIQVSELKTEDGGTVAVYSDITELKKREQELEEMDRLKSNFLSSVSHELRTPLTSVRGFAKLISKDFARRFMPLVGEDVKLLKQANRIGDNLAIIVGEAERLTRLINDVLDISKIESGSTDWREEDIDVAGLVNQAFSAASGQFSDKPTVKARLTIDDDLPALRADRDRLVQVLVNLLNNAAKFTDEGTVELKAGTTEDGWLRFSVRDTGAGIPPEEQEMVFDKFHQVTKSDTLEDKPKGTGLGLTICKQIIEYHGGRIWVESEPDIGSDFIFILPPAGQNTLPAETLDENA